MPVVIAGALVVRVPPRAATGAKGKALTTIAVREVGH